MSDVIRWGFIGLGSIARRFGNGFAYAPGAEIYAVASRSQDKADAFGAEFGASKCYGSYEALVQDPDVDVVYIGTPHNFHLSQTLLALDAGKPVLCEKPFAVNAGEAQIMIDSARDKGLFLMDAFWTRFFPAMAELRQLLAAGAIGDVMLVQADFGYRTPGVDPESRAFSPSWPAAPCLMSAATACNWPRWCMASSRAISPRRSRWGRRASTSSRSAFSSTAITKWRPSRPPSA